MALIEDLKTAALGAWMMLFPDGRGGTRWREFPEPRTNGHVLTVSNNDWVSAAPATITHWLEARNTTAPNNVVAVHSWVPNTADVNVDVAVVPKGTGAVLAQIPNNAISGGNKRGANAVDLQMSRSSATRVASGARSVILGGTDNTASGTEAVAGGRLALASGANSWALGQNCSATQPDSMAFGRACSVTHSGSMVFGCVDTGLTNGSFRANGATFNARGGLTVSNIHIGGWTCFNASRVLTGNTIGQIYLNAASTKVDLGTFNTIWTGQIWLVASIATVGNGAAPLAVGNSFSSHKKWTIKRITNDAGTAIVGAVQTIGADDADANMAGAALTVTADTTDGSLKIEFTPCALAGTTTVTRINAAVLCNEMYL